MSLFGKRLNEIENELHNPFVESDSNTRSPFNNIQQNINGTTRFAITKDTEGGKYNAAGMLYYKLNGVEIYTDLNNIIFVDTVANSIVVMEYAKASMNISPSSPEDKQYIVLYTDIGYDSDTTDTDEFPLRWESYIGRKNTYNSIKANLPIIDVDKSLVLVDTVAVKDSLTVREFIKYLQNAEYVDKEEIDIDEFTGSEFI